MRRPALILLLAGILGVLIFLASRTKPPGTGVTVPERSVDLVEPQREPEAPSTLAEPGDRTAVPPAQAETPPTVAEELGWRVCVVHGLTGLPVPDATVSVLDVSAVMRELESRGVGFDTIEGLRLRRERAFETRTGADGCALVASPPANAMVEARAGAEWAIALVSQVPEQRCVTLKLEPDRPLRVRVVDGSGVAIGGVPVAVRRQTNAIPTFTFKSTDSEVGTGIATFHHFQRRLAQGPGWNAVFAFPLRNEPSIPVDADTPPEPPVTLVLPDTGRVRVRVIAADGSVPDLEALELRLEAFDGEAGKSVWPGGPWARPRIDEKGEALAPWIGLGLQIQGTLLRDGVELVARRIAGPLRPGDEVLCEIPWSATALRAVTGRFVLRDGRPWPAATVLAIAALFPTPSAAPRLREIAVASDGRFVMPVHEERPANGTRGFRFSAPHPEGGGEVQAFVALDQELPSEGLDLGDVLLDFGELLCAGRVFDAAHQPLAGAHFTLRTRALVSGREFWPGLHASGTVRTAADGTFALYLPPGDPRPSEELRLATHADGFAPELARDVRLGERDVEVVLAGAGGIAGSLLLDDGLALDDILVLLFSEPAHEGQGVTLRPDGSFEVRGLAPGTYSFLVRRRGIDGLFEREPAARVEGLLVQAGGTCRDPRLQSLRIESLFTTLAIRVVDRAGMPLRGAAASIVGGGRAAVSKDDGICSVRCKALPVDLDVAAFGHARRRIVNVSTDLEVVLEAGFPICLRTNARPSGAEPNYLLGARLFTVDASGARGQPAWGAEYTSDYRSERAHFDPAGELKLRMPAEGTYECEVFVTVIQDRVGRGATVQIDPLPRIAVLASTSQQVFELAIPEDAVQAAVASALREQ